MTIEKFKLLCWKNFTLQKRHPIAALFEILFPVLIVGLFTYTRTLIPKSDPQNVIIFNKFEPSLFSSCSSSTYDKIHTIGMSPSTNKALVDLVTSSLGSEVEIQLFNDSAALNEYLSNENFTVAGIEFDDDTANSSDLPHHLKYSIRLPDSGNIWLTDQLFLLSLSKSARDVNNRDYPSSPPYVDGCFLTIQSSIDRAFIKKVSNADVPATALQRYPYPSVSEDMFLNMIGTIFPLLFVFCMIFSTKNIIKNVTVERESQLKETMKMMGLSSSLHWLAWFTKCLVLMEISIVGMTILMCTTIAADTPIFIHSNPFLIWLFFNIYATSVITFSFLIAVLFKKASTAANVGSIFFFLTLVPFNMFQERFYSFTYILKVLFCLLVNSGMGQGVKMMMIAEGNEVGLRFSNLFMREPGVGFSIGEVMLVMTLGIVIQMMLTIYIEKVFPGDIGVPEVWYYPVMPCVRFLRKRMGYNSLVNRDAMLQERRISGSEFEDEPTNLKAGIRINNLSKMFGSKAAVNKLNLNIFEDQITVLLGHNGAGKTTTMQMLTGMFQPSSGTAYLNGKDIRTEIDEARQSLGICPQHNILFDELTVCEHIEFFSRLKGVTGKRQIADEIRRYVSLLELKDKLDAQSKTLSGGMKRKLSIGIALCGNSKIVMCDEPSSGMDPAGRRALWDLLIAEKRGRTILLTTHHMDEADVLGDRIAIMAEGQLRTVGSSFFLKKKFGTGYRLICVKEPACDANLILDMLKQYAPDTIMESDVQREAIFIISEEHLPTFEHIFKRLEDNAEKLRVSSFGCNLSTLEEVFLKLGTESYSGEDEHDAPASISGSAAILIDESELSMKITGAKLMLYQIEAMTLKKFYYLRRNYRSILYMAIFTVWMTIALMSAPKISFNSVPPLDISFSTYDGSTTVIQKDNAPDDLVKAYTSLFGGKNDVELITEDMNKYILKKANDSLPILNRQYLIGATISKSGNTAWFNGQPFHTMPLSLNTLNRAILKQQAGSKYDISVTNKPYVWIVNSDDSGTSRVDNDIFAIVPALILFYFLLIYWPSIFIGFYIKERESRAKLLQLISGANRFIYWITAFIVDYIIFFIVMCAITGGVGIYQRSHLSTAGELGTYLVVFMFYGFSMLPLIYLFSYVFAKHSTGESMVALLGLLLAALYGVYSVLKYLFEKEIWKLLAKLLYWFGLMIGPFSLLDSFVTLGIASFSPDKSSVFTFKEDGIGRNLVMMVVGGFFFMTICLMKDHMLFEWFIYKFLRFSRKLPSPSDDIDADVKTEMDRIRNMSKDEIVGGNLVLNGLSKFYGSHLAVNQLYLSVEPAECFGLLGINGAGKTSTFKMMTGDELISSGDAFIRGYSMKNQMQKVHQLIGYCPQFDALLVELTGRETLNIFSLLRGIPRENIKEVINKLATELGFHKHLDKQIKAFSGGNKRKLSTALALLGDPSLIFLDEPTTGMDPGAKRQLWNIINKTRNSGRSVVMTSHSMEECEALCTKLAIMVNGEFKCLGSTQHLKNKFSKGFILTVKAGREDDNTLEDIKNRVQQTFPSAELKEKYMDIMTFHIPSAYLKWSEVFATMAQMKNEIGLADYALTQTSLEQVFLFFTKSGLYQRDEI